MATASVAFSCDVDLFVPENAAPSGSPDAPPYITTKSEMNNFSFSSNRDGRSPSDHGLTPTQRALTPVEQVVVTEKLVRRRLFISKRGMIYLATEQGKVSRSFEAHLISELQPCVQELEVDGPIVQGPRGQTRPGNKELQRKNIHNSVCMFFDQINSSHRPVRCIFPKKSLITEFSQYVRYFNELEAAIQHESLTESPNTTGGPTPQPTADNAPHVGEVLLHAPEAAALAGGQQVSQIPTSFKMDDTLLSKESSRAPTEANDQDAEEVSPEKMAINPIPITHGKVYTALEKIEMRKNPRNIWDMLKEKDSTTTSKWFYDEFHDQAESMRLVEEAADKVAAANAVTRAKVATQHLKTLDQDPMVRRQIQTIQQRLAVQQIHSGTAASSLSGALQSGVVTAKSNTESHQQQRTRVDKSEDERFRQHRLIDQRDLQAVSNRATLMTPTEVLHTQGHISRRLAVPSSSRVASQDHELRQSQQSALDIWSSLAK